jgi:pimeloyl-ACP methyl ester carboxylesterase
MTALTPQTAELEQGQIRYREGGSGEPIVFVHGILVNGRLWDGVATPLADRFRCIVPDWPMGSHRQAMRPEADLSAAGMAELVAGFLRALGLDTATIVGNDSGGAVSQILAARHPERVGRLVLTNCDSHENFPPSPFGQFPRVAGLPGVMTAMTVPLRLGAVRRRAFAPFARTTVPDELLREWTEPSATDPEIRRDARKFAMGMDNRMTLEAAERLAGTDRPTLIAWAPEDRFFPLKYGQRLAESIPGARLETFSDAKTFLPIDQPERLAEAIESFMAKTAAVPTGKAA